MTQKDSHVEVRALSQRVAMLFELARVDAQVTVEVLPDVARRLAARLTAAADAADQTRSLTALIESLR